MVNNYFTTELQIKLNFIACFQKYSLLYAIVCLSVNVLIFTLSISLTYVAIKAANAFSHHEMGTIYFPEGLMLIREL